MAEDLMREIYTLEGEITLQRKLELLRGLQQEMIAAEENLDTMEINRLKLEARKLVEM